MFDNPIIFLILISIISGISEWLGKRRKAKQLEEQLGSGEVVLDDDDTARQQRRREVREQQEDWEERLRRMLAGEDPDEKTPAARAEPPPAPIRQPESKANTPRPPANKATVQRQASTASRSSQPSLSKSNFAGAPAAKVSDEVRKKAAQLERVGRKTLRDRSSGGSSPVQRFRSRSAARNAIMAAVVLGPAKGVGEESDILKL